MFIIRPDGQPSQKTAKRMPMPELHAARIGILDNRKDNAFRLLSGMQKEFVVQGGARAGTYFQKSYVNIPAKDEHIVELSETCDLVLVGSGD